MIQGRIPEFNYDVKLAIVVDGEKQERIPEKPETSSYKVEVVCDKGTGSWDYQNWRVQVSDFSNNTKCNVSFITNEEEIVDDTKESIAYLGTGTSFDVSSYSGYENFTIDNFIVECESVSVTTSTISQLPGGLYVYAGGTFETKKEYSNGILQASCQVSAYAAISNGSSPSNTATSAGKAYLILK